MPTPFDSHMTPFPHKHSQSDWIVAAILVLSMHLGILVWGMFWSPTLPIPTPNIRPKIMIQTVHFNTPDSSIAMDAPIPPRIEEISNPSVASDPPQLEPPTKIVENKEIPTEEIKKEIAEIEKPIEIKKPLEEQKKEPAVIKKPVAPKQPPQEKKKPEEKKPPIEKKKAEISKTPPIQTKQIEINKKPELEKKKQAELNKKLEVEKKKQAEENKKNEAQKKKQEEELKAKALVKKQQEEQEAKRKQEEQAKIAAKEKEVQEKIAQLKQFKNTKSISPTTETNEVHSTVPKEIASLNIDHLPTIEFGNVGVTGKEELSYRDKIQSFLKKALILPDYGAVQIKLTLNKNGKVIKLETIQSKSLKNLNYIERTLPLLIFPSFDKFFQDSSQYTFTITLDNST